MIPSLLLLLLGALAVPATQPAPGYALDVDEVKRVEAVLTYEVHCARLRAEEWEAFAGKPPELPGQTRTPARLEPNGTSARDLNPLARPVLTARVPARTEQLATRLPLRITYEATLRSRRLRPLAPGEKPPAAPVLTASERQLAREQGDIDFGTEPVRAWLRDGQLQRRAKEGEVEFARRVFQELRSQLAYDYRVRMDRHTSAVCRTGRSDCAGLSNLFVAALRANGVPARALYGRWAVSARPGEQINGAPYYQWHVKAEFFARGVGWVPVDVASALVRDRTPAGLAYFGNDRGDFLTLHVDGNLEVATAHFGRKAVHNLQVPVFWVAGLGSVEPWKAVESWQVRTLPAQGP